MKKPFLQLSAFALVVGIGSLVSFAHYNNQAAKNIQKVFGKQRRHAPSLLQVERISEWMTFSYVSTVFEMPDSYLQKALSITDSQYPQITLKQYAKKTGVSSSLVLKQVQEAVRVYMKEGNHKVQ